MTDKTKTPGYGDCNKCGTVKSIERKRFNDYCHHCKHAPFENKVKHDNWKPETKKDLLLGQKFRFYNVKCLIEKAYCSGYEHGHHATVEGHFSGNGRDEEHAEIASEWFDDVVEEDFFHEQESE